MLCKNTSFEFYLLNTHTHKHTHTHTHTHTGIGQYCTPQPPQGSIIHHTPRAVSYTTLRQRSIVHHTPPGQHRTPHVCHFPTFYVSVCRVMHSAAQLHKICYPGCVWLKSRIQVRTAYKQFIRFRTLNENLLARFVYDYNLEFRFRLITNS